MDVVGVGVVPQETGRSRSACVAGIYSSAQIGGYSEKYSSYFRLSSIVS